MNGVLGGIVDITANKPHTVSEVICLKCYKRWISVRPTYTLLIDLECPNCGAGYVIETGQEYKEFDNQG